MKMTFSRFGKFWQNSWGPVAGVATAAVILGVQWVTPHVGDSCTRLGHVEEEWRVGLPARHVICIATLDGDLVYGRLAASTPTPGERKNRDKPQ